MPAINNGGRRARVYIRGLAAGLLCCCMVSCSDYQLTLNRQVVYRHMLLQDYKVPDTSLRTCLQQAIEKDAIYHISELRRLDCNNAAVTALNGMETFSALEELYLGYNQIADPTPLGALQQLKTLRLPGNALRSVAPLASLEALQQLDVRDNPQLSCASIKELRRLRPALRILPPKRCT